MLTGVASTLGWSSPVSAGNGTFLISGHSESDASIMMYDLVTWYLRNSVPVVMISVKEPLSTIIGLFRRLGFELNMLEAQGTFKYIYAPNIITGNAVGDMVKQDISSFVSGHKRCAIFVDDVSLLDSIHEDLTCLFDLINFIESFPNATRFVQTSSQPLSKSYRWLMHRSALVMDVRPLASGLSREFHGQISFKHGGKSYLHPAVPLAEYLFRTTETSLYIAPRGSQLA